MGVVWTPVMQSLRGAKQNARDLAAAKQQGAIFDRHYNCVELAGTNLDQVVTIGASFQHGGVEVGTNQANGTAGRIKQENLAIGAITITSLTTATLVSTTSGSFTSGQVIGAVTAGGVDVLSPGTTFTISGTAITFSQDALVSSGTALYAAACNWTAV